MGRSGFTIFEVLVALAVVALMTGVVLLARPTPSPELTLQATAGALMEEAARLRHRAVQTGSDQVWQPEAQTCSGDAVSLVLFADGTADAAEICLEQDGRRMRLQMNVLAGRLSEVQP